MRIIKCALCNMEFEAKGPRSKYCATCGKTTQKKNLRDHMRKKRGYTGLGAGSSTPTGEEHPNWVHGERAFSNRLSPAYKKKMVYCENCGLDLTSAGSHMWAVHHIDHDRTHNEESNFQLLCKRCHQIEHKCWENFLK